MLILLLLLAFTHSLRGAPLITHIISSSQDVPSHSITARGGNLLDNNRTIWHIVWSCLATIFACTWVAVHPNVPSPKAHLKSKFQNRLMVMAYAWIAPECVTMWAMRQWFAARKLVSVYNQTRGIPEDNRCYFRVFLDSLIPFKTDANSANLQRWTLTHGFFAQMGGYMIFREKEPYWTLFLEDVDMARDMTLVPYYTEEELMDRSKGDVLSKGVALLQTMWFGAQYLARVYYGLPLTELETVTLAFAALNIVTYILWWHKPLNVQCPIRVYEETTSSLRRDRSLDRLHDGNIDNSVTSSLSDDLSIPIARAFDDIPDSDDTVWEELYETPWFPTDEVLLDGATVNGSPDSTAETLVLTPASCAEEFQNGDVDFKEEDCIGPGQVKEEEKNNEEGWDPIELPWFPASEVLLSPPVHETSRLGDQLRRSASPASAHVSRWHLQLPWSWTYFPQCIILTVDGGWYGIHLISEDIDAGDNVSSLVTRTNHLEVNFYIPLFLRNRPWIIQMCTVLPFWSPYMVFMTFYTFGPYRFFVYLLQPLASMTGTSQITQKPWMDGGYPWRVPTFYAGPQGTLNLVARLRIWYTTFFLTSLFGALHAFGWFAHFSSPVERTLWRVSTLTICAVPPTIALWIMYRRSSFPQFGTGLPSNASTRVWPFGIIQRTDLCQFLQFLAARPARIGMPMYVFARIALITIAFTSLRNLPPGAYQSLPWTSAIPHL